MDFWDIFIELERYNNKTALTIIKEQVNWLFEEKQIMVYDDFVNLEELNEYQLITSLSFLNSFEALSEKIDVSKDIPSWIILYLIKFYKKILKDMKLVSLNLNLLYNINMCYIPNTETTQYNFEMAKDIYSNFVDQQCKEELNFEKLQGKLFLAYGNKIIIVYLKEYKK